VAVWRQARQERSAACPSRLEKCPARQPPGVPIVVVGAEL
jgi:hypothetical protein